WRERRRSGLDRRDRAHQHGGQPGRADAAQGAARGPGRNTMQRARRPRPPTARHVARMGPFHLESIAAGGDRAVLRIDGDIDACTAPQLRERVLDLAGHGTVHIIADLRGVGFLDSAGLGALVAAPKELPGRAGALPLGARPGPIAPASRIAGPPAAFALYSCVLQAVTADQNWHAAVSADGPSAGIWCRQHGLL